MLARRLSLDGFEYDQAEIVVNNDSVLSKSIDWQFYTGEGGAGGFFLDDADVQLLDDYDKAPEDDQNALLEQVCQPHLDHIRHHHHHHHHHHRYRHHHRAEYRAVLNMQQCS